MAKPDTWMPLKIEPWTKKTARLSLAERGAYMDLLLAYWVGGPLPADDEDTLKRMARCTDKEWKQVRVKVLAFFTRDGDVLRQGRADEELAEAAARYERRASAGRSGGQAKAKQTPKQNPSIATAEPVAEPQASYKEHSSSDEAEANASGAKRLKPSKGTRLASDWKPSEATREHGRKHNLTHGEFCEIINEFREYFRSPDATRPVKKDWDGACCRWITRAAPGVVSRRARRGQPQRNGSGAGSVFAALSQNLEAGDLGGQDDDSRMGRGVDEDRMGDGPAGSGPAEGPTDGATIIDSDDWRRVPEGAGKAAVDDKGPQREHGGYPADVDVLRGRVA